MPRGQYNRYENYDFSELAEHFKSARKAIELTQHELERELEAYIQLANIENVRVYTGFCTQLENAHTVTSSNDLRALATTLRDFFTERLGAEHPNVQYFAQAAENPEILTKKKVSGKDPLIASKNNVHVEAEPEWIEFPANLAAPEEKTFLAIQPLGIVRRGIQCGDSDTALDAVAVRIAVGNIDDEQRFHEKDKDALQKEVFDSLAAASVQTKSDSSYHIAGTLSKNALSGLWPKLAGSASYTGPDEAIVLLPVLPSKYRYTPTKPDEMISQAVQQVKDYFRQENLQMARARWMRDEMHQEQPHIVAQSMVEEWRGRPDYSFIDDMPMQQEADRYKQAVKEENDPLEKRNGHIKLIYDILQSIAHDTSVRLYQAAQLPERAVKIDGDHYALQKEVEKHRTHPENLLRRDAKALDAFIEQRKNGIDKTPALAR